MSLNRRNFLKSISLALPALPSLLTGCTHRRFYNPDQDIILGGGRFKQNDELRHVLAVVNLQQKESQMIDLDFLAHGIVIDPKNKKRLITFEKNATTAAEIDLNALAQTDEMHTAKDRYFSGHGVFDMAGDTLFCTETYLNSHRGIITIRDSRNLEILSEFPTYGKKPHDCQLTNDGMTLVVANAGDTDEINTPASVNYIDIQSQKLIESVSVTNQQFNTGHISISEDGSLIIASAPQEGLEQTAAGGVSIRSGKQAMLSMTQPEAIINRLSGEALSIAIDNKNNTAAITHPDNNMVTFWSIDKRELIKAMSVPEPRGVTLSRDKKSFIISYNINTSIIYINTKNLTADTNSIMQPSYISGEHLYNWSRILTEIMPTDVY